MRNLLLLVFVLTFVSADVMYEMETESTGMVVGEDCGGIDELTVRIRNFIKGDRMRSELKAEALLKGKTEKLTITRLDKGVIWVIDNENKEFFEIPVHIDSARTPSAESSEELPDMTIKKTGETKEILKVTCEKYVISLSMPSGEDDLQMTQTIWVGKNFSGYDEIVAINKKMMGNFTNPGIIGIDKDLFEKIQKKITEIDGFPLEIELYLSTKIQGIEMVINSKSSVKKISTAPITDRVFELPEGYKPGTSLKSN